MAVCQQSALNPCLLSHWSTPLTVPPIKHHTTILQQALTSLWPSPPSGLVPCLTGRWASPQWCQPENQQGNVGMEARLCNRWENDLSDDHRRCWILLCFIINNIDALTPSVERSAALSHYSAHSAETERTTSHQSDDLKTTNVTGDVPTTHAGSSLAALHVDTNNSSTAPFTQVLTGGRTPVHPVWHVQVTCRVSAHCWLVRRYN